MVLCSRVDEGASRGGDESIGLEREPGECFFATLSFLHFPLHRRWWTADHGASRMETVRGIRGGGPWINSACNLFTFHTFVAMHALEITAIQSEDMKLDVSVYDIV